MKNKITKVLFTISALLSITSCGNFATTSPQNNSSYNDYYYGGSSNQNTSSTSSSSSHTHTYSSSWKYDNNYHWHPSTCGHSTVSDKEYHNLSKWVIEKESTYTEEGIAYRSCSVCGYKETKKIEKRNIDVNRYLKFSKSSDGKYYLVSPNEDKTSLWHIDNYPSLEIEIPGTYNLLPVKEILRFFNTKFKRVILPSTIEEIRASCFEGCWQLEDINLNNVKKINCCAFNGCGSLKAANLSSLEGALEYRTFENCTSLNNIVFSNTITEIGDDCFRNCGFSTFEIPKCVKKLGRYFLNDCKNIKSLKIPKISSTSYFVNEYYGSFYLPNLENLIIEEGITKVGGTSTKVIKYRMSKIKKIIIPRSVEIIGSKAFSEIDRTTIYCRASWEGDKRDKDWNVAYTTNSQSNIYHTIKFDYVGN